MTPRLIALDVDGTLIEPGAPHTALPGERIRQAIAAQIAAGVVVVLATGRMYPGTVRVAEYLGIEQPLICQQGASVHALDGSLREQLLLDPDIAQHMAAFGRSNGWPIAWFNSTRYLATERNPVTEFFAGVSAVEFELHPAPEQSGLAPTGVDIISDESAASGIHGELERRFGDQIHLLDFRRVTAAQHPNATKGQSVRRLAESLGIEAAATVAIGDSANDASMLSWAGLGAAPAHCDRHARAATDRVLDGEGVDGVAMLLESLLP